METPDTASGSDARRARSRNSPATVDGDVRSIADVPFLLQAADPARAATLRGYCARWEPTPAGVRPMVTLRYDGDPVTLPRRAPDLERNGMSLWRQGTTVLLHDRGGGIGRADPSTVRVAAPDDVRGLERLVGLLLGHTLAFAERHTFHAATILLPDGRAVAATGDTGAGKSTLVAVALRMGWRVLGDDLAVLRTHGGVEVTGVPRPPALPPDIDTGLTVVPVDRDASRRRLRADASVLTTGWHPLAATLHIEHALGPDSELDPLASRAAFDQLLASRYPASDATTVRETLRVAAAASTVPAFVLRHGRDTVRRAASTADRLRDLAASVTA